eukprot:scaffold293363_cov28-Tisochrysis_lutea.AAC.3
MWIIGPSLPTISPPVTEPRTPTALATSALVRNIRGTFTPCRYAFTSGIPEPPATGETKSTKAHAPATRHRFTPIAVARALNHALMLPCIECCTAEPALPASQNLKLNMFSPTTSMRKASKPVATPTAMQISQRKRLSRRRYERGLLFEGLEVLAHDARATADVVHVADRAEAAARH